MFNFASLATALQGGPPEVCTQLRVCHMNRGWGSQLRERCLLDRSCHPPRLQEEEEDEEVLEGDQQHDAETAARWVQEESAAERRQWRRRRRRRRTLADSHPTRPLRMPHAVPH